MDFEEAAASVPAGLLPMLDIPGLGPKTIALFWKQRGVTNIEDLVKGLDDGSLAGIKGIGEKKLQSIKQGIAMRAQAAERRGIGEALPIAEAIVERLKNTRLVDRIEIAGSLRRGRETIGDVDLVCSPRNGVTGRGDLRGIRRTSRSHAHQRPGHDQILRYHRRRIAGRPADRAGRKLRRRSALFHRLERSRQADSRLGADEENDVE